MGIVKAFKTYIYIFILLACSTVFAQTEISGRIKSVSGEILAGASVLLKDKEKKIVSFAISGDTGGYQLEAKNTGEYTLEVNFLGFEKSIVPVTVTEKDKTITQNFSMKEGGALLKEVVIEAEAPVKRKGDTLSYDAKALSTGKEVVVEDLLKNIPGITVLPDGTIKYGDVEIDKVMVEGDDLFNKGYSLITKNMPTQPLDKIEILRNYSKNKLLKGVEDSKGVALNLTIDEKFKTVWFGNLTVGYGNENRYKANGNLMNFGKKYKNYFSASGTNAGLDYVGNINSMQYGSSDLETVGSSTRATQLMYLSGSASRIDESRSRFNNAQTGTFSSIFPLGSKSKLRLNGFLGYDRLSTYSNALSVYDFQGTSFTNTEQDLSRNNIQKAYVSAYFNADLSANQMFQTLSTFNTGRDNFNNSLTFNGVSTLERLQTRSTYFDQQATYTHKWNKRNVVLLKSRFLTDRLPQDYSVNSYLMGDLFSYNNINAVGNTIQSSKQYAALEADFKLKQKNDDLIAFTVGFENNSDDLATRFSLFTDDGVINPADFQAHAKYDVGNLYAKSSYEWKFKKFSVGAGLTLNQLFNRFENAQGGTTRQQPFLINPNVNARYEINGDNFLYGNYSYNISNSTLLQVNDAYLLTSSRGFSKGLGYFNQFDYSSTSLGYTTKHYLNRYSFSVGASYSKQNDAIASRRRLEQNSSLSEAFIIRGGDNAALNVTSHIVVKKLKGSLGFDAKTSRTVYFNEVNGSGLRENTAYGQTYKMSWHSSFKSAFNFRLASEWSFSKVVSDFTFKNHNKTSYLDITYRATDALLFTAKAEHYNFGGLDNNNNYFFADFEASYSFKKDAYAIMLDGRNLFNTQNFTTYSVSDVGYATSSYRLLPRYVMLSFRIRF